MISNTESPVFEPFAEQQEFIDAALSLKFRFMMLAGTIRSGKTFVIISIIILLCRMYPGSKWAVVRKDLPALKKTTLPTFFLVCPKSFLLKYNKSDHIATMKNGSEILFMSENAASDPECEQFKGLEVNGFFLSQAESLRKLTYETCKMRIDQWVLPEWVVHKDLRPPAFIFLDANPAQGWIKDIFYDPFISGTLEAPHFCQLASIENNPHITQQYLDDLRTMDKVLYDRFVKGMWDAIDDLNQLIGWEDIRACQKTIQSVDETMSLGADIGRHGKDPTVFYLLKGPNIFKTWKYPQTKTTQCRDFIMKLRAEYNIAADHICVDAVGVGGGVVDELLEKGIRVIAMEGGARDILKRCKRRNLSFSHWKSWSYWEAAESMKKGEVGNFNDELLKSDAGAIWYYTKNDLEIKTEGKDDLKKRIGRSCDDWDAFVYAWWAYKQKDIFGGGGGIMTSAKLEEKARKIAERKRKEEESRKRLKAFYPLRIAA